MKACHSTAFCHLGTTRTLQMLEHCYWWIGMSICTRRWLRHCLKCQTRKTPRLTIPWPIISMPLPERLGVAIDYVAPLPVTPRGNTYVRFFTDHFSRRAYMHTVTADDFTAKSTANIIINRYTPLWEHPRSILTDNCLQVCSKLSNAVNRLWVRKIATTSYHPSGNAGVERVNDTMA